MTIEQITSTQENIATLRQMADAMSDNLVQQCADYIIERCNNRGGEWLFKTPITLCHNTYKGFRIRKVERQSKEFRNDRDYYMCIEALTRWDSHDKDFTWVYWDYLDFEGQHLLSTPNSSSCYVRIVLEHLESRRPTPIEATTDRKEEK